jgi:uncharacterized protein
MFPHQIQKQNTSQAYERRETDMGHRYAEIAFTNTVKSFQSRYGSRDNYAHAETGEDSHFLLSQRETAFIGVRDSFYMASVSETGWPYVQHRGGPQGFVKVLDQHTIGFADFRGNRQYVSVGNLSTDNRVSLFFMDYAHKKRLKLLGRVSLSDSSHEAILKQVELPEYRAQVERAFVIKVEAFDWNCPQHITQRFTLEEVEAAAAPLHQRIAALEAELARRTTSVTESSPHD